MEGRSEGRYCNREGPQGLLKDQKGTSTKAESNLTLQRGGNGKGWENTVSDFRADVVNKCKWNYLNYIQKKDLTKKARSNLDYPSLGTLAH